MKSEDEHMRSREDSGYKQGRSRREGSHPGRVPDAVKDWKNERGKRYGMDTGYYSRTIRKAAALFHF